MNRAIKKFLSLTAIAASMSVLFLAPGAFAVECDADGDGYVALTQDMLEVLVADNQFQMNGNYSPDVWNNIYNTYRSGIDADPLLNERYKCDNINFKKGAEPARCDSPNVASNSGVFDNSRVGSLAGSKVNPGTFDIADNGIDEDCDGGDGKFLPGGSTGDKDLGGLVDRVITLLSRVVVVVSILILIWGGVLYATAAGDENKTSKARKAIIGAIIGLIVGLLAPTVVNTIVTSIG